MDIINKRTRRNVKITMLDLLMSFLAPHHCSGCTITGALLCDSCKYDILSEPYGLCVSCAKNLSGTNNICSYCKVPYQRAWCVADRRDQLQRLIGNFKFSNARSAYISLADLLHARLPELPENTIIVPIPTVNSHIRERGYDHMLLVARRLSRLRGLPLVTVLQRATNSQQRSAGRLQRIVQAKKAFYVDGVVDEDTIYLIIDDVITTGATIRYAAKSLIDAGAKKVWVASISRQPLD